MIPSLLLLIRVIFLYVVAATHGPDERFSESSGGAGKRSSRSGERAAVFIDKKTRLVYNSSNQLRIILIVCGIRLRFAVDGGRRRVYNIRINMSNNFAGSQTPLFEAIFRFMSEMSVLCRHSGS